MIVAPPSADLPAAAKEGTWLSQKLPGTRLYRDEATRAAVLAALEGASLFHFAGHAVFRASSPWKAHLVLSGAETVDLEDLFLHPPRVRLAVLNGCRTGAESSGAIILPHVFLLAGSEAVLAADGDIEDGRARRFIETFYEAGGATEPGRALAAAVKAARERGDEVHQHFKLFGRPVLR